jgi:hypothetical protein
VVKITAYRCIAMGIAMLIPKRVSLLVRSEEVFFEISDIG